MTRLFPATGAASNGSNQLCWSEPTQVRRPGWGQSAWTLPDGRLLTATVVCPTIERLGNWLVSITFNVSVGLAPFVASRTEARLDRVRERERGCATTGPRTGSIMTELSWPLPSRT